MTISIALNKKPQESVASVSGFSPVESLSYLWGSETIQEDRKFDGYTHPSAYSSKEWCARNDFFDVMRFRAGEDSYSTASPAHMKITFEIGNAMHHWIQNKWFTRFPNFFGKWECPNCHLVETGLKPSKCSSCGCKSFSYKEMYLTDSKTLTAGSIDALFKVGDSDGSVILDGVDIKTISKTEFDKLKKPNQAHVIQLLLYINLLRSAGYLVNSFKLLYVCKEQVFTNYTVYKSEDGYTEMGALREFEIMTGDYEHSLAAHLMILESLAKNIEAKVVPSARCAGCASLSSKKARSCQNSGDCFVYEGGEIYGTT